MLTIRFLRAGKKAQPFFRIVVTDKKNPPRGGEFVESVGFYNPLTKEKGIKVDRIKYWLSVGAQPSDTVHNLLVSEKVIDGKKIAVHSKPEKANETESSTTVSPEKKAEEIQPAPVEEEKKEISAEEVIEEKKSIENDNEKSDNIEGEKKEEN